LGPLLFCHTSLKLAKLLKAELNIWYMDDGTLGGDVEVLLQDLETVRRVGRTIGLVLNEQKCELVTDDSDVIAQFRTTAPAILHIRPAQATLPGAPVGATAEIDVVLTKKIDEFQRLASRLKTLSAHDAFFLLKNCFSLPKLQYVLRCAPCYQSQALQQYDSVIRDTLQHILNIALTDSVWLQATLPVRNGGIGIRLATQLALPTFLSSMACCNNLVLQLLPQRLHISSGVSDPMYTAAADNWTMLSGQSQPPQHCIKQKAWDTPLVSVAMEQVLSTATIPRLALPALLRLQHHTLGHSCRHCLVLLLALDWMTPRFGLRLQYGSALQSVHHTHAFVESKSIRPEYTV
jgi:hypothetical protein